MQTQEEEKEKQLSGHVVEVLKEKADIAKETSK